MKALIYRGVDDLRVETVPVPRIRADELLVRVAACGVCPTDIKKIHYGTVPPPRIFGHETAGTIARVGALVRGFRVGERVALHHHIPCLDCHECRHGTFAQCKQYKKTGITAGFEPAGGGFAEYVRVMPFVFPGVVKIPAKNAFEEGAMLEPVNTVLKAVRRLNLLTGDCVLVIGQGPIGLMFTKLLSLRGIRVLATDLFPTRLKTAKQFGAKWAVHGEKMDIAVGRGNSGRLPDAVVLTVPSDELALQAQQLVRPGGQVLLFAHTARGKLASVDLSGICVDERDLIGSYSADVRIQKDVAKLVFSRQFDVRPLITHRFPLDEGREAIQLASRPTETSLKVVVAPSLT